MGTHLRVLSGSCLMSTNMTGFRWFSKTFVLVLLTKVASALKGLRNTFGKINKIDKNLGFRKKPYIEE